MQVSAGCFIHLHNNLLWLIQSFLFEQWRTAESNLGFYFLSRLSWFIYSTEIHTIDSDTHDNANSHSKHSLFTRSIKRIQTSARTHRCTGGWPSVCPPPAEQNSSPPAGSSGPAAPQNRPPRDTAPWTPARQCSPAQNNASTGVWSCRLRPSLHCRQFISYKFWHFSGSCQVRSSQGLFSQRI